MTFTVICPYVDIEETVNLQNKLKGVESIFWHDRKGIGSDLAYEYLWNSIDTDVFIMHADMSLYDLDWKERLETYVEQYPEAGIFGTTLLYPAKHQDKYIIQHAGGIITENGEAIHIGGGVDLSTNKAKDNIVLDEGQFDNKVFEVSWVTFGGVYIRRSLLNKLPKFDRDYVWTYYRDVDYCFKARELGSRIYQLPIKFLHYEGMDNKKIIQNNPALMEKINFNYSVFNRKWKHTELFNSLYREIT